VRRLRCQDRDYCRLSGACSLCVCAKVLLPHLVRSQELDRYILSFEINKGRRHIEKLFDAHERGRFSRSDSLKICSAEFLYAPDKDDMGTCE
jgi:hypothetical protein